MTRVFFPRKNVLFIVMGFVTMTAQIIAMRRFIIAFGGNELATGAVFAGWLGFSGIGNLIAGRFADRAKDVDRLAALSLAALALAIPTTTVASMLIKALLGIPPPVIVGSTSMILPIALSLGPLGIAIGASFTFACRLPEGCDASNIGRVYALDTIGAGIGGIVFSLVAIELGSALQASFMSAVMIFVAIAIAFRNKYLKISCVAMIAAAAATIYSPRIETLLLSIQWRGYNPVIQKESRFSNLVVTDNRGERTMFIDGKPAFSLPLPETYEALSHLALIEHGDPKDVAIIGSGIFGVIDQWKNWNLKNAYFIRLDPALTAIESSAMPSDVKEMPPWSKIIYGDGRGVIRDGIPSGCRENCLDAVVVAAGDPVTASADRYFTSEFFKEVKTILRPDGVFMIGLLEPANAISAEAMEVLGTVMASLDSVFSNTIVMPLDRFYFISSGSSRKLTDDPQELAARLVQRGLGDTFLATRDLAGIYPERVKGFEREINRAAQTSPSNTDLKPFAYFAGILLWEERAGGGGGGGGGGITPIIDRIRGVDPMQSVLPLAFLAILFLSVGSKYGRTMRFPFILATLGFSTITYEIVLLIHYQMAYGILVWRIGMILTAFMVGAGLGAALCQKFVRGDAARKLLVISLVAFAIYIPLLFIVSKASFVVANLIAGFFGGWIYQIAVISLFSRIKLVGKTAGIVESSDHWGAAVGSLLASVLIIPIFGLMSALIAATAAIALSVVLALGRDNSA